MPKPKEPENPKTVNIKNPKKLVADSMQILIEHDPRLQHLKPKKANCCFFMRHC